MNIMWVDDNRDWSALYVDNKFICAIFMRRIGEYMLVGVPPSLLHEHRLDATDLASAKDVVVEQILPLILIERD